MLRCYRGSQRLGPGELTRYRYDDAPLDLVGRYLYVNDGGTVWNPGWKPTKTPLDRYECRHGFGYTRIAGAKAGVEVDVLFFVPPGEDVEVWRTTVRNTGAEVKDLRLFSTSSSASTRR